MSQSIVLPLVHDGFSYVGLTASGLIAAGVPEPVVVAAYAARLQAAVDDGAERARQMLITPGAGQAMEYQEAQTQAAAALKAPSSATVEKYPMLAASIGIDVDPTTNAPAVDVLGVARAVMAAYQGWQTIGAEVRRARLRGKEAIGAATTLDQIDAAFNAISWPSFG